MSKDDSRRRPRPRPPSDRGCAFRLPPWAGATNVTSQARDMTARCFPTRNGNQGTTFK